MTMQSRLFLTLAACGAIAAPLLADPPGPYEVELLDTPGGSWGAVSDNGLFAAVNGRVYDLQSRTLIADYDNQNVISINNSGIAISTDGAIYDVVAGEQIYLSQHNFDFSARGVNNLGQFVGRSSGRPAVWQSGQPIEFLPDFGRSISPIVISDTGYIAGIAENADGDYDLVRWTPDRELSVIYENHGFDTILLRINDAGHISSVIGIQPAIYADSDGTRLLPGADGLPRTWAFDLGNKDNDFVVGFTFNDYFTPVQVPSYTPFAAIWSDENIYLLEDLLVGVPDEFELAWALGIADDGTILASAHGTEFRGIYLLHPVEDATRGCPADVNRSGHVDIADLGAWIGAFIAQDLAADVNVTNSLEEADFTSWLNAYQHGCP